MANTDHVWLLLNDRTQDPVTLQTTVDCKSIAINSPPHETKCVRSYLDHGTTEPPNTLLSKRVDIHVDQ